MRTITNNSINKHTYMFVFFSVALLLAGCRGDKGPMGPAGNANVQSVIFEVPPQHWSWSSNLDCYMTILTLNEITSDIYNYGAVLVYKLYNENSSNESFNMLPYTYVDSTYFTYMDFDVFVGEIDLYLKQISNGVNVTEVPAYSESYKVIIVEGTPLSVLKSKIDVSNYKTVLAYFGSKDNNKIIIIK